MLVVTRRAGEKIVLPGVNVEITLIRMNPNGSARIGVTAPREVVILRKELAKQ